VDFIEIQLQITNFVWLLQNFLQPLALETQSYTLVHRHFAFANNDRMPSEVHDKKHLQCRYQSLRREDQWKSKVARKTSHEGMSLLITADDYTSSNRCNEYSHY
jgi:hypothetical protein